VHPPSRSTITLVSEHGHVLLKRGTAALTIDTPILVSVLGHEPLRKTYDAIHPAGDGIRAEANLMMADGTHLAVKDEYVQTGDDCVRLDRVTEVLAVGTGMGVSVGLNTVARAGPGAGEDWQFYLPCTLYNRNDSDGDGVEDYLGSYAQDLRDDKNGVLAVLVRQPANGTTFSVARLSIPAFDTALIPDSATSGTSSRRLISGLSAWLHDWMATSALGPATHSPRSAASLLTPQAPVGRHSCLCARAGCST
jgi:hypothetical protein